MTELLICDYILDDGEKCDQIAEASIHGGLTNYCGYHFEMVRQTWQEPTLVKCPYCGGHHAKYQIDLCPLNPYKQV